MDRDKPLGWEEANKKHQKFIKLSTKYCIGAFVTAGVIYIHLPSILTFCMKYRGASDVVSVGMHYEYILNILHGFFSKLLFFSLFTDKIYTDWNYIIPFYVVAATSFAFFVGNYSSVGFFFPFVTKQVAMAFKSIQIRIDDLGRHVKQMKQSEVKRSLEQIIQEHVEVIG